MRIRPNYAAHAVHYGPARSSCQIWRLLVGLALATGLFFFLTQFYLRAVYAGFSAAVPFILQDMAVGNTALSMYLLMFSFALITVSVVVVVKLVHLRRALSLLGPLKMVIAQFATVTFMLTVVTALLIALMSLGLGGDEALIPNVPFARWLLFLPLSLIAVLVQVSSEEILFRGYIQQQLAARFRSPLVWMILPSLLFATGHYQPEAAGENALLIAIWAGVFGVLMADLTARAGSLGPAIAVHFCNNVLAILVTSLPDELTGLALYLAPFGMDDTEAMRAWLPVDFAQMIVFWLTARLALRR